MATAKKSSKDPLSLDAISNLLDTKLASLESRLESKAANLESKLARLENKLTTKMSELEGVVRSLDTKLQSQASDIQRHEDKIVTLEKLICEKIHTIETLEKKVLSTTRTVDQYKFKITDLENRSRRQNLRIIGLPEKVESGDLTEFFSNLLWEVFGAEALQAKPIIDRAHRVSRFSATGDKPRAVIVRLHYPREKELSIRLARQKDVTDCKYDSIAISDHAPLKLSIKISDSSINTRSWRLNATLLQDPEFITFMKQQIDIFFSTNYTEEIDRGILWDSFKAFIHGQIISYSAGKRKQRYLDIALLVDKIK
ncbi:uncharacterized protein LOC132404647 [Hypanus sabinus]|uniref:uncharacterized protein LOC132404647 n=1 Tax=Hypanus sabinus TaxID=79690 RepID=UPI0028C3EC3A|nr:uncharacterized protein LOC132404647 [Hypanus sabinus]